MGKTGDGGVLPRGGGVWSPRPTSAVKLCPLRPSPGNSAACTARDVEDAVPYESGILDCQKHGAVLCSRTGLPLRFSGDYVLRCIVGLCFLSGFSWGNGLLFSH